MSNSNGNSILKLLGALLVGIFGLWLVFTLIFGSGFGMSIGLGRSFGDGHMYMGTGYGFGSVSTISLLLIVLIKVLFVVFIIGLVLGIAVAIKKYLFTDDDIQKIKGTFTGKKTVVIKETCTNCSKELNDEWKVCPFCGNEKETINA